MKTHMIELLSLEPFGDTLQQYRLANETYLNCLDSKLEDGDTYNNIV